MASKKPAAKKPRLSEAERAIKQTYGQFWGDINPRTGKRPVIDPATALTSMFNNPESPNYRPTSESASGRTPFALGGTRIGFFDNRTGEFSLAGGGGGKAGGRKKFVPSKRKKGGPRKKRKAGDDFEPSGAAETGTTSFARSYGKTNYRVSAFKGGPGKAEVREKKKEKEGGGGAAGGKGGKRKPGKKKPGKGKGKK